MNLNKNEIVMTSVVAGVVVAGATDIVLNFEKIRRSMWGQEQHYLTKNRGPVSRLAHAWASQTAMGRAASWAFQRVAPQLEEGR